MHISIHNLLKKINYLEAEIEIQKQILFSLPEDQRDDMEQCLTKIADFKEQINAHRLHIKDISPDEYERIISIEEGLAAFKKLVSERSIKEIFQLSPDTPCLIECHNGNSYDCLLKACDEDGSWIGLTEDGKILAFEKQEVISDT